ncbi:MAG: TIGR00282 family metallophosphoesterase [Chloroflexi bacterium]|nr:TIGR00282 family metallophosphoesterase [Chloroflexota bacterium]
MRVLLIGDVVGRPGRQAVRRLVPSLRQELGLDLVVANGENAAAGFGITPETARELLDASVDIITSGNHIWDQREIIPLLGGGIPLLRPLNYPSGAPGRGTAYHRGALVVSLQGRVFMPVDIDDPFRAMDELLGGLSERPRAVLVDFHAEATSEKAALAWYLDGRISAVVGTHTHVGTTDARVLPKGTAFVSDLGMCGVIDSVIGDEPGPVIERFLTGIPVRLTVGSGPAQFNAVLIETDEKNGLARSIVRMDRRVDT